MRLPPDTAHGRWWARAAPERPFGGTVGAGECVRISTGAIVPPGATCVLLQEDAARAGNSVTATERPAPGRHIRARGFDFTTGDLLLTRGNAADRGTDCARACRRASAGNHRSPGAGGGDG